MISNKIKQKEKILDEIKDIQTEKSKTRSKELLEEVHIYSEVLNNESSPNNS